MITLKSGSAFGAGAFAIIPLCSVYPKGEKPPWKTAPWKVCSHGKLHLSDKRDDFFHKQL